MNNICPLCLSEKISFWTKDKKRNYFRCKICHLIFVDAKEHLTLAQEKAIYLQHENKIDDVGYRQFLSRIANPMLSKLAEKTKRTAKGLDFGCGPGPALAHMFREAGYQMSIYDPFFAPNVEVLDRQYDFVTCTEAIEHFCKPYLEWGRLNNLLCQGGVLGIMTKLARGIDDFNQWHYKNDPTHVSFFSRETFCFLSQRDGLTVEFVADDAILFTKPNN